MALGIPEKNINTSIIETEALIETYISGLAPGVRIYICPGEAWNGITAAANLNALYTVGRLKSQTIQHSIIGATGTGNNIWAIGLLPNTLNRLPLSLRFTNAAGELT